MGTHELALVGLTGSGLGTVLSVPMVWPRPHRSVDVRLLGSAFLLMSAIAALISARLAGFVPSSVEVEHAVNALGLCAFPLLVLYTHHAATGAIPRGDATYWWAPAVIYTLWVAGCGALGLPSRVPFAWLLPVVLGFTATSVAILFKRAERRAAIVPAEAVVAFVVMLNLAQIIRMQFGHVPTVRAVVPLVLSAGFLAMAALAAWRAATPATPPPEGSAPPRYEHSGLEESHAPDLLARIDLTLTRERLFARADLTLAQLAAAVHATPHQVSEVLNRFGGVSFHDKINRCRVEDVKVQLIDPANDRYTIEGIGASAGFGSRSALYAAFRRFEGITPAAFRARHRPDYAG